MGAALCRLSVASREKHTSRQSNICPASGLSEAPETIDGWSRLWTDDRPFVVIDFEVEGDSLVYLDVSNLGSSLARDVTFAIDPPLTSAAGIPVEKLKMINEGISTLAPGKRIRTFFDLGFRRGESDLPLLYQALVKYTDETGKRKFAETLDLDLDLFMHVSTVKRNGLHEIHERSSGGVQLFEE